MNTSDILKSFESQDDLNPKIWFLPKEDYMGDPEGQKMKMRPEIRERLLEIANQFIDFLGVDAEGLHFSFDFPDTATGNEVRTLVGRGDVDQASWAFTVKKERWENVRSEKPLRVIEEVGEIYDISLTPRGANPTTSVALRSLEEARTAELPEELTQTPSEVENHEENQEVRAERFVDASAVQGKLSKSEARDLSKFNLVKAINEARSGKLTGIEAEINQEGINEKRKLGLKGCR